MISKAAVSDEAKAFEKELLSLRACEDARVWAKGKTAAEAWEQCERGDWLLWWVGKTMHAHPVIGNTRKDLVKAACACARLALKHVPEGEDRPRLAIEAAERWADEPTEANLDLVREARRAAAACADIARKMLRQPGTK